MADINNAMAFLNNMGLPEVLLWLLSFAVVFEILIRTKMLGKAPAAIVALVLATFALFAAPAAMITSISSMSSSLIIVLIGFFVVLAILEFANVKFLKEVEVTDAKGNKIKQHQAVHPFEEHGKIMTIVVLLIALMIFWLSGGAALIGLGNIPSIGVPWVLVIIGIAVLWLIYESGKEKKS